MTSPTFRYLFDPLCGWCYASASALDALAERYGDQLELMPTGLFAGAGARPMSVIADHAERNDRRIGQITGQVHSEAYFDDIVRNPRGKLDSGPAMYALVALGQLDPALEPRYLHAVQIARYVDARDTSLPAEAAAIAVAVAAEAGITLDAAGFERMLTDDKTLAARVEERMDASLDLMERLSVVGVPSLVMTVNGEDRLLQNETIYGGGPALFAAIDKVTPSQPAHTK
ncbi:MAG: putative DsbA-like thioredoxin protein [Bradyrhizobium sp.]|nr:putative DsbA-like thioredoxin protein [Bradyrhizobium sp.]